MSYSSVCLKVWDFTELVFEGERFMFNEETLRPPALRSVHLPTCGLVLVNQRH